MRERGRLEKEDESVLMSLDCGSEGCEGKESGVNLWVSKDRRRRGTRENEEKRGRIMVRYSRSFVMRRGGGGGMRGNVQRTAVLDWVK